MREGWSAKGLLQPLWNEYAKGAKGARELLAVAVGTTPTTLSAINSGTRNLGADLGGRLAAELGVSLLELGAPEATAGDRKSRTMLDRLAALAAEVERLTEDLAAVQSLLDQRVSGPAKPRTAPKPKRQKAAQ